MQKTFIYVRVSTEEQAKHGFSISAQQKNDIDFAIKNDYQVTGIYIDEGRSAKNMERPQLQALLKDIKNPKKKPDAVIVWRLDRITRNNEDYHARIKPIFRKNNVKLLSATETNDFENPMGDFFRNLGISQAELERYITSARTKAGQKERAEQGYYPSKPPLGYKNEIINGKKIAMFDSEKAHYVKQVYELYATGNYSLESIADKLNQEGFTHNKKPCTKKIIEKILGDYSTFYLGQFNFAGKRYNGKHEKLISRELYNTAMDILHGRLNTRKGFKREFLYRGIIKSAICGRYLTAETQRGRNNSGIYNYYRCTNKCLNGKKYLKEEYIDEAVKSALDSITITEKQIRDFKDEVKEVLRIQRNYNEKAKIQIDKKIKLLENRLNKLYDEKIDGEIDNDFYNQKKSLWQNELDELMLNLTGIVKSDREIMKNIEDNIELLKMPYSLYSKLSFEKKREFLKIATSNFTYDGEEIHLELNTALQQISKIVILSNNVDGGT